MISITVLNKKIKVNLEQLKEEVQKVLGLLNYHDFSLNILLTSNNKIQEYNKKFRNVDKATDILSFPFWPDLKPGERINPSVEDEKQLGDILISLEYVESQLKELKTIMDERLKVFLVHGICHLIGYTHETDSEYEIMKAKEEELLSHLR